MHLQPCGPHFQCSPNGQGERGPFTQAAFSTKEWLAAARRIAFPVSGAASAFQTKMPASRSSTAPVIPIGTLRMVTSLVFENCSLAPNDRVGPTNDPAHDLGKFRCASSGDEPTAGHYIPGIKRWSADARKARSREICRAAVAPSDERGAGAPIKWAVAWPLCKW
jgi:hypothetical protein